MHNHMTAPVTPYSSELGDREPIAALRNTIEAIRSLAGSWAPEEFERRYAPGKWTARQVVTHLAQTEMALGTRVRMALATPGYVAQNFDQDAWIVREEVGGAEALDAFVALGRMNRALFASLSAADRAIALTHPEYGPITIDWVLHQMAGHQVHHLRQLERIR
jgi:hypothetical protein